MYPVRSLLTAVVLSFFFSLTSHASSLSFARCDSTESWDLLDLNGDVSLRVEEDSTVPRGYGPRVLRLEGSQAFLLAKAAHLKEGTLLVLWKDEAPLDADADGVILFQADYGDDLTEAHNTKQARHHFWVEQDADKGFQIKEEISKDNDRTLIELPGTGLTQDLWNKTGWIWQKLSITEGMLRAKFWSSAESEPEKWQIEIPGWKPETGRVGLKVWSGRISIAHFALAQADIHVPVPPIDLQVSPPVCYALERLRASLFLNQPQALPGTTISLKVASGTSELETTLKKDIPTGASEVVFGASGEALHFPEALSEGKVMITANLLNGSGAEIGHATRMFEFRSVEVFRKRIEGIRNKAKSFHVDPMMGWNQTTASLEAASARAHLDLAQKRIQEGREAEAEKSILYAEEALAGFDEPVFATLEEVPRWPGRFMVNQPPLAPDHRVVPYSCLGRILAKSMVMGETYEVEIDLTSSIGQSTEPITAQLILTDDIGIETPLIKDTVIPVDSWKQLGKFHAASLQVAFRLPDEFPTGSTQPIQMPAIREGYHRLWITLMKSDGTHEWIEGLDPEAGSYTTRYQIGRIYVTQNPIEILERPFEELRDNKDHKETLLRNVSDHPMQVQVVSRLCTDSGKTTWTNIIPLTLQPRSTVAISTYPPENTDYRWLQFCHHEVEVLAEQTVLTRYSGRLLVHPRPPQVGPTCPILRAYHDPHVAEVDGNPKTRIVIECFHAERIPLKMKATVSRESSLLATKELEFTGKNWVADAVRTETRTIEVEPALGTYNVVVSVTQMDGHLWSTEIPVIAPVFENRKGKLYLNGEPFIVKGVNVHGMIGHSPERNRQLLRFLKDIGFNTLRGDFPPVWQVQMAGEENLGYMALPPFSVNSTDYYKKMYSPHPFPKMREITRRFIRTYRDEPALWFWNSCNEVTGEITDLLVSVYPLYKLMDPAQRLVLYANLYGQNETVGQDLMAGNSYFGVGQDAASLQPLIQAGIAVARKAGLPCIFTEFNCWYGPVYSRGVEAIQGLYEYGLEQGTAGGCLYLLAKDPLRHPAVIASRDNLWTNPTFIAALHHAFDDAEVVMGAMNRAPTTVFEVRNRRDFWLRKVRYAVHEGKRLVSEGTLEDIAPKTHVALPLEGEDADKAHVYEVEVWFETHHGLRGQVKNRVLVEGARH